MDRSKPRRPYGSAGGRREPYRTASGPVRIGGAYRGGYRPGSYRGARRGRIRRGPKPGRLILIFVILVLAGVAVVKGFGPAEGKPRSKPEVAAGPAVEAGVLPWKLAAPVSRYVAFASGGATILIFGGMTSGGGTASGIYALDTRTGVLRQTGDLAFALHDAAGARLSGVFYLFGGGAPGAVASVEAVQAPSASRRAKAVLVGELPHRRVDGAALVVGRTAYLVGGYDGTGQSTNDAVVLATTNGRSFAPVARLPVPVRYPAVAALGGVIYVFGGIGAGGVPVDAVQRVDPSSGSARVVGRLPLPLEGAAAAVIGGRVYLAGGATTLAAAADAGEAAGAHVNGGGRLVSVATIWSFEPNGTRFAVAGRLPLPVANGDAVVLGGTAWIVGGEAGGSPRSSVQMFRPNPAFGRAGAPGAGSPFFGGRLLIADRGNNRLLLLSDTNHIVWRYPSASAPPPPGGFYFPDDAFFEDRGHLIISNQEQNDTIMQIAFPSGKVLWRYGHPRTPGSAPGYLHEPDDAYLLPGGRVVVADAFNCRILFINHNRSIAGQIGTTGRCRHDPPTSLGVPNGATPLSNGDLLVSEVKGSWVSEYTRSGSLLWELKLPIAYPSDPQRIGPDRYLVADYARPGAILEFNRAGTILYRYQPKSGAGMLNHPSLAELLPSGVILANDDYNDRIVAIDPRSGALVWQYGSDGKAGAAAGLLSRPDGFDLLMPGGLTPTHLEG